MDQSLWYKHKRINTLHTILLLAAMGALLGYLGWQLGGWFGLAVAFGVIGGMMLFNPMTSPTAVLRMHRAQRLPRQRAPELNTILVELARRAELASVPLLYLLPGAMLNAFAVGTGRQSSIAITEGILRRLELEEVIGVLAHEVAHVRNKDIWVMGLASLFSRLTDSLSMLGMFFLFVHVLGGGAGRSYTTIVLLIFAPTLSIASQAALSRTREYDADLNGALLCGNPRYLARALAKIARHQGRVFERIFIPSRRLPETSMFSTHPPIEERIRRLIALEQVSAPMLERRR